MTNNQLISSLAMALKDLQWDFLEQTPMDDLPNYSKRLDRNAALIAEAKQYLLDQIEHDKKERLGVR